MNMRRALLLTVLFGQAILASSCRLIEVPAEDNGNFLWCVTGAVATPPPLAATSETAQELYGGTHVFYDVSGIVEDISVDRAQTCGNRPSQVLTIRGKDGELSRFYLRVDDPDGDLSTPNLPLAIGGNVRLIAERTRHEWVSADESVVIEDDLGLVLALRRAGFSNIDAGLHEKFRLQVWEAGRGEYWSMTCGEGYSYKMKFSGATSVILAPNESDRFELNGQTFEARNIYFSKMTEKYGCTDVGGGAGSWLVVRRW